MVEYWSGQSIPTSPPPPPPPGAMGFVDNEAKQCYSSSYRKIICRPRARAKARAKARAMDRFINNILY